MTICSTPISVPQARAALSWWREAAPGVGRALRAVVATMLLTVTAAGCSYLGFGDDDDVVLIDSELPPDVLYQQAEQEVADGRLNIAVRGFEDVERLYPTSSFAKRAIIRGAEIAYRAGDFDKAILGAKRYLDFYPSDEKAPFAQYLIAVSHYDQITDVGRDQARTKAALQSLRELVNRYPNSDYTREAQIKLDLTIDHLAGKEMDVGRYYLKRGQYIGAINRFRTVVERYQTTTHTPEALHRLVEAYLAIGVEREAQTAAAVLGHNFPGSDWYQDSYGLLTGRNLEPAVDDGSWMSRTWRNVVSGEWL
ncbi:MAG: outer membrane protein assembly factor BamD [Pseudomonadota bacterium]